MSKAAAMPAPPNRAVSAILEELKKGPMDNPLEIHFHDPICDSEVVDFCATLATTQRRITSCAFAIGENLENMRRLLVALVACGGGNTVHQLRFSRILMGKDGAKIIPFFLPRFTELKRLVFDGNNLCDSGLEIIAPSMSHLDNISVLSITRNNFSTKGIRNFGGVLSKMGILRQLDLSNNEFGNDGVIELCHRINSVFFSEENFAL